jgi:hypothetical protein
MYWKNSYHSGHSNIYKEKERDESLALFYDINNSQERSSFSSTFIYMIVVDDESW